MKKNRTPQRYVICLSNQGCEDLEVRKIYQVVPDAKAAESGHLRVIDESGEDYLYPQDNFAEIALPKQVEEALAMD
jgi:hypothetical protein